MLSLSPIKILLVVVIALIVLGPDKLPEVARQVGTLWNNLKQWQTKIETEVREVVPDLPSTADIARIARSPVHLLNELANKVTSPLPPEATEEVTPPMFPEGEGATMPRDVTETEEYQPPPPPTSHINSADPSLN
jgi:sec-independent protein translocase protein TatB